MTPQSILARVCGIVSCLSIPVCANTEKAIFVAPSTVNTGNIVNTHTNLEDFRIDILTPGNWAVRTYLEARFPTNSSKFGKATWLLLDELNEGQRYEVRMCWAATQPTDFTLNIYELPVVFDTPELISDLSEYSWSRLAKDSSDEYEGSETIKPSISIAKEREASVLFLQVLAAADFYTPNRTLMDKVPPVHMDIILDPYVFNVLPQSLVPTIGYVIMVAVSSYLLARRISTSIQRVAMEPNENKKQQ